MEGIQKRKLWLQALKRRAVLRRAVSIGMSLGLLQVVLNQGDHWVGNQVDMGVLVKTILTPVITFLVAYISAAAAYVEREARNYAYENSV